MVTSKLRNKFSKSQTSENWKKNRNRRETNASEKELGKGNKANYFNNLNPKVNVDSKKFS